MTTPVREPGPGSGVGQRALDRFRSRSIWWFVALAVFTALVPLSPVVQIPLFVLIFVAFWLPLLRVSGREAKRGYRDAD